MKIFWIKESFNRLIEIESHIGSDSPDTAFKFINQLIKLAESLSKNPEKK